MAMRLPTKVETKGPRHREVRVLDKAANQLLGLFKNFSGQVVYQTLPSDGPILAEGEGVIRTYIARRLLGFPDAASAAEAFPALSEAEIAACYDEEAKRFDVIVRSARFQLVPSADRKAYRVVLDSLVVLRTPDWLADILAEPEELSDVLIFFTLRYMTGELGKDKDEVQVETVVFSDSIDLAAGNFHASRQVSDWIPLRTASAPHSIYMGVFNREDVSAFVAKSKHAGDSLLHFVGYVKRTASF